jgi:hypothetical protein
MSWHKVPRHARRTGAIVVALLLALLLFLALFDWSVLTGPLQRLASRLLERDVHIARFSAHLLRWEPSATIEGLRIADPAWAGTGDTVAIDRISVAIIPWRLLTGHVVLARLEIDSPSVSLKRDRMHRANWDFGNQANEAKPKRAGAPLRLPAVRSFTMHGGKLKVDDEIRKLQFDGSVSAGQSSAHRQTEPFVLQGHGQLNGKAFDLIFKGSPLFDLRLDKPYDYQTELHAGPLSASAQGSIDSPFDMAHMSSRLELRGDNLAGMYYLTGLALPFTPPFHVAGNVRRDDMRFTLSGLDGSVGHSDLHGTLRLDASGTRPKLTAELSSHALDLADLAPSVGAGVPNQPTTADIQAPGSTPGATPPNRILPTYQFKFDRLRSTDATVELRADSVQTQKMPMKGVDLKLNLEHGVLQLDPADFDLPQGQILGRLRIDATTDPVQTQIELRLRGVQLSQFKSKTASVAPLDGTLLSHVQLQGHGNSVHDVLSTSDGTISAVIPHGEIREAFAQLTGVDVARGLGLLITGNQKQVDIRCGIATFQVSDGEARAQHIVFDTQPVLLTGSGDINFDTEALDLRLQGKPKKLALRLLAPITVTGDLAKPAIGIDPKSLLAQGGVAAALAVVATPAAAVLAFIDPGLAKNQDCAALLQAPLAKPLTQPSAAQSPAPPRAVRNNAGSG